MDLIKIRKYLDILLMFLVIITGGCVFPFTTASYKWNIQYDKNKLAYKKKFLQKELPPYSVDRPPNILLIVMDDLGKSEISCYGSTTVKTPHIDQIASEGIQFTDCYVTAPVSAPSRAGLLTGRYNERYGFETQPMEIYPNNLPSYWIGKYMMNTGEFILDAKPRFPPEWQIQKQGLLPTEINLAEFLKMRNYSTACIGKWHLGFSKDQIPNNCGFDYQYGFYGAFSLCCRSPQVLLLYLAVLSSFGSDFRLVKECHGFLALDNPTPNYQQVREQVLPSSSATAPGLITSWHVSGFTQQIK
jgi:hypothetical protein